MQNTPSNDPNGGAEPSEVRDHVKALESQLLLRAEAQERMGTLLGALAHITADDRSRADTRTERDLRTPAASGANLEQTLATLERAVSTLAELDRLNERATLNYVQHLRSRMHHEISGIRADLSGIRREIAALEGRNSRDISEILNSRIWRALRFAGAIVLNTGSLGRRALSRIRGKQTSDIKMFCDEPQGSNRTPTSGAIKVRGWAIAASGIDHINVQVDGQPSRRANYGLARSDVSREHPLVKGSGRSGFELTIDPALLPQGEHTIRIEAVTSSGQVKRMETGVVIERAFARDYDRWIAEFEDRNESDLLRAMESFPMRPLISLLMPVYKTPREILKLAIESVRKQTYENWELCIADDCSEQPELDALIEKFARIDSRIKTMKRENQGGVSAASNSALELARGEFVGMLDHDDELSPDALFHVVEAINKHPGAGLLYSDEDKIDISGRRYDPFFKPAFSPDLLLSDNYICHFGVCRRDLLERAGGFRPEYDGSQDYDLFLRISRLTGEIIHIPRVLYHWRSTPGSTAADPSYKPHCVDAARRAIEDHLRSGQIAARVEPGKFPGYWRVRYEWPAVARVSILIPSGGKQDVLQTNLNQLATKTEYPNYEIVVIDNSRGSEIEEFVRGWYNNGRGARYVDCRGKAFNWAALNNQAARLSTSELLLFLNDDTEVIASDWLTSMVELGMRPEVGAVGAKLLYPDGRIQHAGVVMGLFENCGTAFRGLPGSAQHYFNFPDVIRNVSAVTGACLLTRRDVFWEVGGFDEERFAVAFNDIDFCLKITRAGYRVLYTPHACLYHHESFSLTKQDLAAFSAQVSAMQTKWTQVIGYDPYYSPNLTRSAEDYSLGKRA
jgi:O-antigen biosynthesis protein